MWFYLNCAVDDDHHHSKDADLNLYLLLLELVLTGAYRALLRTTRGSHAAGNARACRSSMILMRPKKAALQTLTKALHELTCPNEAQWGSLGIVAY